MRGCRGRCIVEFRHQLIQVNMLAVPHSCSACVALTCIPPYQLCCARPGGLGYVPSMDMLTQAHAGIRVDGAMHAQLIGDTMQPHLDMVKHDYGHDAQRGASIVHGCVLLHELH